MHGPMHGCAAPHPLETYFRRTSDGETVGRSLPIIGLGNLCAKIISAHLWRFGALTFSREAQRFSFQLASFRFRSHLLFGRMNLHLEFRLDRRARRKERGPSTGNTSSQLRL